MPHKRGTFCCDNACITSSSSAVIDAVPLVTFIIVDNVRWSVDSNLLYLITNNSGKYGLDYVIIRRNWFRLARSSNEIVGQ